MSRKAWDAFVSLVLVSAYGADTSAQDSNVARTAGNGAGEVRLETFTGPRSLRVEQPRYPREQISRGQEGWVRLTFMVGTQGEPYEIAVTDAVGDEGFQRAAIRALRGSIFEPARMGGNPIDAGHALTYEFQLEGGRAAARRQFVSRFRQLTKAIDASDRSRADELLQRLEPENLYERAYLELGKYLYYRQWSGPDQQLIALHRAVGHDPDPVYLPEALFKQMLRALFALQLEVHDFAAALGTAERLKTLGVDDDLQAGLDEAAEEIRALQADDRSYLVDGNIGASSYSWFLQLLKSNFRVTQVNGRVAEMKLRCAGKFIGFTYDPELVYRVSEGYMPCLLEVVGDPGTTFQLVQY